MTALSKITSKKDIIDLEMEGTRPRDLERMFKDAVLPVANGKREINRDVDIERVSCSTQISALDFNIISTDGKMTVDRNQMVRYLKARRIVYLNGIPFRFDGCIYSQIADEDVIRDIHFAVDEYKLPTFITRSMAQDIVAKLKATSTILDIEPPKDWDEEGRYDESELVPFFNGLYNIKNDEFLRFTPYVFFTYQLGGTYNPRITEHPVEEIYRKIIPDDATRRFFFEMVGYSLFSQKMSPPAIFVIYGPGNTGKSALQSAVTALAGAGNISSMDLTQLSGTFTTAELMGKLINICGETGSGQTRVDSKVDGELLKRLSDGQAITVQHKHGKPFQMVNRAKLWFITNTLPDFGDTSSGMYRRLYIIPCRQEQNWEDQIYEKLTDWEAVSWLANKALEGYRDFLDNDCKFHVSFEMLTEIKSFKGQDTLMDFFEAYLGTTDKNFIPDKLDGKIVKEVWTQYDEYSLRCGGKGMGYKKFREKVRNEYSMNMLTVRTYQQDGKPTNLLKFIKPRK